MLYFGRVGSSWGYRAFFGSSWGENVITPMNYFQSFSNIGKKSLGLAQAVRDWMG
jgi:hypothetical protein